jgi:hypothetical protein
MGTMVAARQIDRLARGAEGERDGGVGLAQLEHARQRAAPVPGPPDLVAVGMLGGEVGDVAIVGRDPQRHQRGAGRDGHPLAHVADRERLAAVVGAGEVSDGAAAHASRYSRRPSEGATVR